MFGRHRGKVEAPLPLRIVSAVPSEGQSSIARVVFDVGVDKEYVVCGVPIRPVGFGNAFRSMVEAPVVCDVHTPEQLVDFVLDGTVAKPEVL